MNKKKLLSLLILISLVWGFFYCQYQVPKVFAYGESLYSKIKIFTSILETIQRAYLEEKDTDELIEDAITGMLSNLDPHTTYLASDEFRTWNENFEGYSGIGIKYDIIRGQVTVLTVLENGPAARLGILPGDRIVAIDGKPLSGVKLDEAARRLKGHFGTLAELKIDRDSWPQPRAFRIRRERIILNSIPQALMIKPEVGYVKIDRFTSTTSAELEKALNELEHQGMKNLVLDLRDNAGGYLNAAVEVADKFIPGNKKIVYTKGRLPSSFQEYYSTSEPTHPLYPLIVLIDHGSASASEIVAGAIQDLDRGLVVGKSSFGKGLVQSQFRFQDGSALLVTTAKYYTPSGRPIQREYYNKSKEEYYGEAYDDQLRKTRSVQDHSHKYRTLSGRPVSSGNGIMPDVWVENRENILSQNLRLLFYSDQRYFYTFVEDYIQRHPGVKKDMEGFIRHFELSNREYRAFFQLVKNTDPNLAQQDYTSDKEMIKFIIKRELAYLIWGDSARFRVNILRDKQLRVALKYFPNANRLLAVSTIQPLNKN
ncbi:MAG: S41 family peptidase [bacterium]